MTQTSSITNEKKTGTIQYPATPVSGNIVVKCDFSFDENNNRIHSLTNGEIKIEGNAARLGTFRASRTAMAMPENNGSDGDDLKVSMVEVKADIITSAAEAVNALILEIVENYQTEESEE